MTCYHGYVRLICSATGPAEPAGGEGARRHATTRLPQVDPACRLQECAAPRPLWDHREDSDSSPSRRHTVRRALSHRLPAGVFVSSGLPYARDNAGIGTWALRAVMIIQCRVIFRNGAPMHRDTHCTVHDVRGGVFLPTLLRTTTEIQQHHIIRHTTCLILKKNLRNLALFFHNNTVKTGLSSDTLIWS